MIRCCVALLLGCYIAAAAVAQPIEPDAVRVGPVVTPAPATGNAPMLADDSRWQLGFAVGHGERGNPLVYSDDVRILLDIDVGWFGDRWFFDNGDAGLTLKDAERYTLNLIGRINSDRVFFSKTDSDLVVVNFTGASGESVAERIEVPDRDYALELGVELLTDGDWGDLQLAAHHDASGRHEGYELYVNYGRPFRKNRWSFEPSVGFSWKSQALNDYYWGVRADESNVVFPTYRAGAGLNSHARFAASYRLNEHWAFLAVADYERLSAAAARSPIVDARDVRAVFAGFSYRL